MNRLLQKVATIMESDRQYPMVSLASLLYAGSVLYGGIIRKRQVHLDKGLLVAPKLPCPVISIGNITVGGTGKTPMTIHLARMIRDLGHKVVVLSRGYKGTCEKHGMVVSDGHEIFCDAHQSGDEPLLMAKMLAGVPVLVGRSRYATGQLAIDRFDPDIILLDDGFQHQQLARDLNILLLDAQAPFGNSFLLPRGRLREPVSSILRADVIVFTRCNGKKPLEFDRVQKMVGARPIFCATHEPVFRGKVPAGGKAGALQWSSPQFGSTSTLADRRLVAFSGLAHNKQFWDTIESQGARLVEKLGFDDHYPYHQRDIRSIVRTAQSVDCDALITTEKDFVRLPATNHFPLDLLVMGVAIEISDDGERWKKLITESLGRMLS